MDRHASLKTDLLRGKKEKKKRFLFCWIFFVEFRPNRLPTLHSNHYRAAIQPQICAEKIIYLFFFSHAVFGNAWQDSIPVLFEKFLFSIAIWIANTHTNTHNALMNQEGKIICDRFDLPFKWINQTCYEKCCPKNLKWFLLTYNNKRSTYT